MKFVLAYTTRPGGSVAESITAGEAAQKLLANWAPSPAATMHQWVQRCDARGGFAVLETEDAAALFKDLDTWAPWIDFEVHPVLDIGQASPLVDEALAVARSVI